MTYYALGVSAEHKLTKGAARAWAKFDLQEVFVQLARDLKPADAQFLIMILRVSDELKEELRAVDTRSAVFQEFVRGLENPYVH